MLLVCSIKHSVSPLLLIRKGQTQWETTNGNVILRLDMQEKNQGAFR